MRSEAQYVNASDPELFHLICTVEDDDAPYKEFVRRFHPELKQFCKRTCELRKLDSHIGGTIAHDVFERVRKSKTFKKEYYKGGDGHKWVLAYLLRSASRLFLNHHNDQKRREELPDTYFDRLRALVEGIDPVKLKDVKDITEILVKKLTPNELAVALADLEYKRHAIYLPDDVTLALSEQLGLKPASLRKTRERYKKKLNKFFNEINEA